VKEQQRPRKLVLNKETIRDLKVRQAVEGGAGPVQRTLPFHCPSCPCAETSPCSR